MTATPTTDPPAESQDTPTQNPDPAIRPNLLAQPAFLNEDTSEILFRLACAVGNTQHLFRVGERDYSKLRAELSPRSMPRGDGRDDVDALFNEWLAQLRQELSERATPVYDMRAIILDRVRTMSEGAPAAHGGRLPSGGLEPSSLRYAKDGDLRWDRRVAADLVNALLEDGTLVLRRKLLWLPEAWKSESRRLGEEAKRRRARDAERGGRAAPARRRVTL